MVCCVFGRMFRKLYAKQVVYIVQYIPNVPKLVFYASRHDACFPFELNWLSQSWITRWDTSPLCSLWTTIAGRILLQYHTLKPKELLLSTHNACCFPTIYFERISLWNIESYLVQPIGVLSHLHLTTLYVKRGGIISHIEGILLKYICMNSTEFKARICNYIHIKLGYNYLSMS